MVHLFARYRLAAHSEAARNGYRICRRWGTLEYMRVSSLVYRDEESAIRTTFRCTEATLSYNTVHLRPSHQPGGPLADARGSAELLYYRAARVSKRSSGVRNVLSEQYCP